MTRHHQTTTPPMPADAPSTCDAETTTSAQSLAPRRSRIARLVVPLVIFGGLSLGLAGVAATTSFSARNATNRAASAVADSAPQPAMEPDATNAPLADEIISRSTTSQPSWLGTYPAGRDLLLSAGTYHAIKFDTTGRSSAPRLLKLDRAQSYRTSQRGVFNGHSYLFVTSGPLTGYWVSAPYTGPHTVRDFTRTIEGTLGKGTHSGYRFYGGTEITVRKQVTMPSKGTYQISRRGTFGGVSYVYFTTGPLAATWVLSGALDTTVDGPKPTATPDPTNAPHPTATATAAPTATPPPGADTAVWKTLVLVYRTTDVTYRVNGANHRFQARINDSDLALQLKTVKQTGGVLLAQSNGLVTLDMDVVMVDHPVTHLDQLSSGYWFGSSSAKPDLDRYAPPGKYDSIITIWQAWNASGDKVPTEGWGLTIPPGGWANGAGYTTVLVAPEQWWITGKAFPSETFVHEWMHQAIGFFEDQGYTLPDLHRGEDYGYHDDSGSWMHWYSDYLQAKIKVSGGTSGIKPAMWRSAQPTRP